MAEDFKKLNDYFPLAKLPFVLQEGSEHDFGLVNEQLPLPVLEELLAPYLPFELNDFTEILPGFHWRSAEGGYLLVFWAAQLMRYSFFIFSYSKEGVYLDNAEVAGLFSEDEILVRRMANILNPNLIHIIEGVHDATHIKVNPMSTAKWEIELLKDGKFIQLDAE